MLCEVLLFIFAILATVAICNRCWYLIPHGLIDFGTPQLEYPEAVDARRDLAAAVAEGLDAALTFRFLIGEGLPSLTFALTVFSFPNEALLV